MSRAGRIDALHASPWLGVLAVTGGGSGAVSALLQVPGASATVLEARVPYAGAALAEWLGGTPDQACAEPTARAMAMAAFTRARVLAPDAPANRLFGLGVTAALASRTPKRGEHRIHLALQTAASTRSCSVHLAHGARLRAAEEALATGLVLDLLATLPGATAGPVRPTRLGAGDRRTGRHVEGEPAARAVVLGEQPAALYRGDATPPAGRRLVFPGSFNPVHAGHRAMVQFAEARTGLRAEYELCVRNVDKPPLDYVEIAHRAAGLHDDRNLWLTGTGTFAAKSAQFPRTTFVVGIDTLVRIADPRFYGGSVAARGTALQALKRSGARFLVFGRRVGDAFRTVDDADLPATLRALCDGVGPDEFRHDASSSQIRARQAASSG